MSFILYIPRHLLQKVKIPVLSMYNNLSRRLSTVSSFFNTGHFLSREEILAIKATWNSVIGEDTGMHGINIFLMYF